MQVLALPLSFGLFLCRFWGFKMLKHAQEQKNGSGSPKACTGTKITKNMEILREISRSDGKFSLRFSFLWFFWSCAGFGTSTFIFLFLCRFWSLKMQRAHTVRFFGAGSHGKQSKLAHSKSADGSEASAIISATGANRCLELWMLQIKMTSCYMMVHTHISICSPPSPNLS